MSGEQAVVCSPGTVPTAAVHASSAQSTETSNTHVTQIAFDAHRAAPLPFAHRKRLPKPMRLAGRTQLGGDNIVSQVDRRQPRMSRARTRQITHQVRRPRTEWVHLCGA
jgi:hypothetical protein